MKIEIKTLYERRNGTATIIIFLQVYDLNNFWQIKSLYSIFLNGIFRLLFHQFSIRPEEQQMQCLLLDR